MASRLADSLRKRADELSQDVGALIEVGGVNKAEVIAIAAVVNSEILNALANIVANWPGTSTVQTLASDKSNPTLKEMRDTIEAYHQLTALLDGKQNDASDRTTDADDDA